MQIGNKVFKPTLIPTIVTLLILPVLLRLGFWQLDRAEEKREIVALFKKQNESAPLLINESLKVKQGLNYRNSQVEGNYNPSKLIFIDNKIYKGKTGVYVLTPFRIKDSQYSILVNRGWVPMVADRTHLPDIHTTTARLKISGKIKTLTEKPFMIGEQFQSNQGWPALMQWINLTEIEKKSGLKLLPYIFLLDEKEKSGFIREWKPVVMQPEKSTSYAVQWFMLAFALVVIYIVVNFKNVKRESKNGE